jgi:hypothetical protein
LTQVLHLLPSFGIGWYCTMAGAILSCARALALIATTLPAAANPALRTRRRVVSLVC